MYQGYLEELSKIQNTDNSKTDESVTNESKGSLWSPTVTENTNNTTSTSY